ncbi:hypothetical protein BT69DRAFT_1351980 [Atractiella rhizophila]|nr:hypothetical protein BT69DRAFT_1351980 [Atractiella rhizophila]
MFTTLSSLLSYRSLRDTEGTLKRLKQLEILVGSRIIESEQRKLNDCTRIGEIQERWESDTVRTLLQLLQLWTYTSLLSFPLDAGSEASECIRHFFRPIRIPKTLTFLDRIALSLLQGIILFHPPSKKIFESSWAIEVLLDLVNPSAIGLPISSKSTTQTIQSDEIIVSCLDVLLASLVDYSVNIRAFEKTAGLEVLVGLLKRKKTPVAEKKTPKTDFRFKALEILYFYLLPEESPSLGQSTPTSKLAALRPEPPDISSNSVTSSAYYSTLGDSQGSTNSDARIPLQARHLNRLANDFIPKTPHSRESKAARKVVTPHRRLSELQQAEAPNVKTPSKHSGDEPSKHAVRPLPSRATSMLNTKSNPGLASSIKTSRTSRGLDVKGTPTSTPSAAAAKSSSPASPSVGRKQGALLARQTSSPAALPAKGSSRLEGTATPSPSRPPSQSSTNILGSRPTSGIKRRLDEGTPRTPSAARIRPSVMASPLSKIEFTPPSLPERVGKRKRAMAPSALGMSNSKSWETDESEGDTEVDTDGQRTAASSKTLVDGGHIRSVEEKKKILGEFIANVDVLVSRFEEMDISVGRGR